MPAFAKLLRLLLLRSNLREQGKCCFSPCCFSLREQGSRREKLGCFAGPCVVRAASQGCFAGLLRRAASQAQPLRSQGCFSNPAPPFAAFAKQPLPQRGGSRRLLRKSWPLRLLLLRSNPFAPVGRSSNQRGGSRRLLRKSWPLLCEAPSVAAFAKQPTGARQVLLLPLLLLPTGARVP